MQKLSQTLIEEYRYESEFEREEHIKHMEDIGYECTGQVMRTDDSMQKTDKEYYYFGRFTKHTKIE